MSIKYTGNQKEVQKAHTVGRRFTVGILMTLCSPVIQVHFDGWSSCYDYWIDADSPDIHPVGWCSKTGHPLQAPLSKTHLDHHDQHFHFLK